MDVVKTELLLKEIEGHPIIWDISNENYKNQKARQMSWDHVCATLIKSYSTSSRKEKKTTVTILQKRWKTVRDSFIRKSKRILNGNSPDRLSKYIYYGNLKFLEDNLIRYPNRAETTFVPVKSENESFHQVDNTHGSLENSDEEVEVPRKRSKNIDKSVEERLIEFLDRSEEYQFDADRMFLESLLPTLSFFNDDEKLQFRIEVLNLIQKIKNDN